MTRSRSNWKKHETDIAKAVGGERVPCNGESNQDVTHEVWSIQHKTRKDFPGWWRHAWEQAVRDCPEGKTPLVTLTDAPGQGRKCKRYVVMRLEDFVDWHGRIEKGDH